MLVQLDLLLKYFRLLGNVHVCRQPHLGQHNVGEFQLGTYRGKVGNMFQEDKADVGLTTLQQVQQEGKDMGTEEMGAGWGGGVR